MSAHARSLLKAFQLRWVIRTAPISIPKKSSCDAAMREITQENLLASLKLNIPLGSNILNASPSLVFIRCRPKSEKLRKLWKMRTPKPKLIKKEKWNLRDIETESYDYYEAMFGDKGSKLASLEAAVASSVADTRSSYESVWGEGATEGTDLEFKGDVKTSDSLFSLGESLRSRMSDSEKLKNCLEEFIKNQKQTEMVLKDGMSTLSSVIIDKITKDHGLHWQMYGTKKNIVKVVSKYPLARYRPEFDPRTKCRHKIYMDPDTTNVVRMTLNTLKIDKYQDDWVHEEIPNKSFNNGISEIQEFEDDEGERSGEAVAVASEEVRQGPNMNFRNARNRDTEGEALRMKLRQDTYLKTSRGQQMMKQRSALPSFTKKQELLKLIQENRVIIVSGETGCGKTTQLPQFLLEEAISEGRATDINIICTQPRRISAMSVSKRVADERGEELGQTVGYQIRLGSKRSAQTRLLFCTSGVLLRRLIGDLNLDDVTHVVVDEIHERGMNEDFLLIILKQLIEKRSNLRLILMSATLDAELFANYFSGAPILHIPGFTYPVTEYFLEDLLEKSGFHVSTNPGRLPLKDRRFMWYQKPKSSEENQAMLNYIPQRSDFAGFKETTFSSIRAWASCSNEKLYYGLVEAAVEYIVNNEPTGGILVFLTGWDDITAMMELLNRNPVTGNPESVKILPLHSTLESVSQQEIFEIPPQGIRKVVLATNIAETSITINDIVYVVNGGKAKEKSYDALNNIACLFPTWISKASCKQRKGRAGRVQPGVCYHLFPKPMYKYHFKDHQLPEIMRTPLSELCLQIKSIGLGSIKEFMASAINPPSPQTVENAIDNLKSIGAITKDEQLTPLGRHLALLPVGPSIAKMILMGCVFGCLDPCLTLAAATTGKDPFLRPPAARKEVDALKQNLAAGTCSDHIALLRAYEGYREASYQGYQTKWDYCRNNFLSYQAFELMDRMRLHFAELLANIGFIKVGHPAMSYRRTPSGHYNLEAMESTIFEYSKNSANLELLRAVLCSGMFPNVAIVSNEGKKPSFLTLEDGSIRPHNVSVNSIQKFFPHRWVVYTDKVQTEEISFRSSTMVTDLSLLLFGGDVELEDDKGNFSIMDGQYLFKADADASQLIADLRQELQALLEKKIKYPDIDMFEEGGSIVGAVLTLLSNERQPNKPKEDSLYSAALDDQNVMEGLE